MKNWENKLALEAKDLAVGLAAAEAFASMGFKTEKSLAAVKALRDLLDSLGEDND